MKTTCFVILLFFIGEVVSAQSRALNHVKFGVRAGLNMSSLNFSSGSGALDGSMGILQGSGLHFGLLMVVPVSGSIFIQPEYLYSQMQGETENSNISFSINYFSLPVLLRWQPFKTVAILAGPQFGLVLGARGSSPGLSFELIDDVENRHFGMIGEVEIRVLNPLSISIRYIYGLNMVDITYLEEKYEFKYELWQLSAAYKF